MLEQAKVRNYWKYESAKKNGMLNYILLLELLRTFAIRTELYRPVEKTLY
jgi:hypothetical protein